jgi:hypothetical protein
MLKTITKKYHVANALFCHIVAFILFHAGLTILRASHWVDPTPFEEEEEDVS